MVSRLGFDALSALALALTALIGAYTPAYLAKRDRLTGGSGRSLTYVLGNMLSAGVMVSAGFCHLLGEALKQMPRMQFPLAPFLCGAGYLFTLVADKIAASSASGTHYGCGHGHGDGGGGGLPKGPTADSCCAVEVLAGVDIAERGLRRIDKHSSDPEVRTLLHERTPSPSRRRNGAMVHQHSNGLGHVHSLGHPHENGVVALPPNGVAGADDACLLERHSVHGGSGSLSLHDGTGSGLLDLGGGAAHLRSSAAGRQAQQQQQHQQQHAHQRDSRCSSESLSFELEPPGSGEAGPLLAQQGGGGGNSGGSSRSVSFLTAVLMGVALCFHSLLEGAAMGAQPTISNSLHIFIAIVSHKGLAAYALGSSIVDSNASMQRFWSVVLPFTAASPIGIFIGYIVSDVAKGVGAASISALASGTFLYVAFMEVIPKELREPAHMAAKLAALLTGFCLMSVLAIWA